MKSHCCESVFSQESARVAALRGLHILDTLPKDELLQVGVERLCEVALGLLSLLDRPRPKLFARSDAFGRFVSALYRGPYAGLAIVAPVVMIVGVDPMEACFDCVALGGGFAIARR